MMNPRQFLELMVAQYKPSIMPLGLTNALSIFQDLMNKIFLSPIWEIYIGFYNDILVKYQNEEDHMLHSQTTLNTMR